MRKRVETTDTRANDRVNRIIFKRNQHNLEFQGIVYVRDDHML